jgi:hypothetical protein
MRRYRRIIEGRDSSARVGAVPRATSAMRASILKRVADRRASFKASGM